MVNQLQLEPKGVENWTQADHIKLVGIEGKWLRFECWPQYVMYMNQAIKNWEFHYIRIQPIQPNPGWEGSECIPLTFGHSLDLWTGQDSGKVCLQMNQWSRWIISEWLEMLPQRFRIALSCKKGIDYQLWLGNPLPWCKLGNVKRHHQPHLEFCFLCVDPKEC